jgi:hypothetical protein
MLDSRFVVTAPNHRPVELAEVVPVERVGLDRHGHAQYQVQGNQLQDRVRAGATVQDLGCFRSVMAYSLYIAAARDGA